MVLFHLIYDFDFYLIIETWKLFIKFEYQLFVMRYAIWYHLYNLKNKQKNNSGGVLLLGSLQLY